MSLAVPEKVTVCEFPEDDVKVNRWPEESPTILVVVSQFTEAAKAELICVEMVQVKVNHPLAAKSTEMDVGVQIMLASAELRLASFGQWSGR